MSENTYLIEEGGDTVAYEVIKEKSDDSRRSTIAVLSAYMAALSDYHTVQPPQMELITDLITRAKGPSRSMRQFSAALGVSPATMSRIMNQKTNGPINNELLAKIAANADPQSGVTLEMLMLANGGEKKGKAARAREQEEAARKAILDALVGRGYVVNSVVVNTPAVRKGPGFMMSFDLELETDAVGKNGKPGKWLFEFKSALSGVVDGTHPPVGAGRYRQWLTMVMSLYYCGEAEIDRISYVVNQRAIFDQVRESLEKICIPDEISVILVANGRVVEEYVAPTTGDAPKEVFYKIESNKEVSYQLDEAEKLDWDMDAFAVNTTSAV